MSKGYQNEGYKGSTETVVHVDHGESPAFEKLTYSWNNINVFASPQVNKCCGKKKRAEEKHILKDVSGICRPGELLAIMGASGAGKTTLLNVLTSRNNGALRITGDLHLNGKPVNPEMLTSRCAYVQQDDLFVGTLTVREQLVFQAQLRMDKHIPHQRRMQRVDEVIEELGLAKCSDTLIGVPGRIKGISGGETKRLAFACEVLTNPPLMLCDEPTSGLDSFMAQNVVQVMKNMTQKGRTIISTIHQPSSEVFALFDRILLMAEGRVGYLGSTSQALVYLGQLGKQCPKNYNPADFFITTLAIEPDREIECREFANKVADTFLTHSDGAVISNAITSNMKTPAGQGNYDTRSQKKSSPYKATWWSQFNAVLTRAALETFREPMILRIKILQTVMVALLLGVIYFDQDYDQAGIQNINGCLFLLLTNMTFTHTFGVVNTFCAQLPIFLREHFNGMYRTDVYFLAKNLAELPLNFLLPATFVGVIYFMVGFTDGADKFFLCVAIVVLVSNVATSYGYMISCMTGDVNVAIALAAPMIIPLMLFGGFFLNSQSVPSFLVWLQYMSWFNYGNEALVINQWKNVTGITCTNETTAALSCIDDGNQIIRQLGYDSDHFAMDFGALVILLVGYRIVAYLLLLLKTLKR